MGDYPGERVAVMFYGTVTTLAGASFCLMRYYAFYVGKLVDGRIDRYLLKLAMIRSIINPILHSIAVLLALVDTRLSIGLYIGLPIMFFVPSKLERHIHSAAQ
jgi:hypothetical protein